LRWQQWCLHLCAAALSLACCARPCQRRTRLLQHCSPSGARLWTLRSLRIKRRGGAVATCGAALRVCARVSIARQLPRPACSAAHHRCAAPCTRMRA
jgi:hypothetical protein